MKNNVQIDEALRAEIEAYCKGAKEKTRRINEASDAFYEKLCSIYEDTIGSVRDDAEYEKKAALKEAIWYLCLKYGCENMLTTAFRID